MSPAGGTVKLALAGLHHESNTFAGRPADLAAFGGPLRGTEIVDRHATAHSTASGFLASAGPDVDVVPLVCAYANPCGPVTANAFDVIVAEITEALAGHGPWDGVLLAQHGAAVSDHHLDADAEVLRRVRQVVGPDVPVGMALDMHANLSDAMVEQATVSVGYLTNPHIDARPRALRCAELVIGAARGTIRPVTALCRVPVLVNILRQHTGEQPMAGLLARLEQATHRPGVLDVSLFQGFPYADVPELGMSVVVVADGDPGAAHAVATDLAEAIWECRTDLQDTAESPVTALAAAAAGRRAGRRTLLLDVGDNIGAGAPGDSTVLLAAAAGIPGYFQTVCDPAAVRHCVAAGEGARVALRIGGAAVDSPAPPVPVRGRVRAVTDGRYEEPRPRHGGRRFFDAGPTVVLDLDGGPIVLLTSGLVPNTSLEQLRAAGVALDELGVVVAKGVNAPLAAFGPVVDDVVRVDTPGVTRASYVELPYRNRPRLYPFEPEPR
ncbi:MAG TPA: M81 family metallopeptidase [Pseudonocardiaceae bacterium]|nr:M81 family metallopeptidase [Pseudonocardiaceae bacterium]